MQKLVVFCVFLIVLQYVICEEMEDLKKELNTLKGNLQAISRQLMLQQFFTEEKIRNDGFSGIKQLRTGSGGLKNYFSNTQSGNAFSAIHDHANNIRTVGMGEFIGVLNGVEFRTRHNDFRLNQPHSTSPKFHAIEPIPFPDVPPEVLNQPNVSMQAKEMRKWFKAWKNSDHSVRDYRKFFQPILCYLEGAWTTKQGESIDEPFESDRHKIDASSWFDLQEKVKYTSYTGTKSLAENLAFLPTTIMRFENETIPVFAQWNYRILCHKLKTHVPLTKFRPVEDLSTRMMKKMNMTRYEMSRAVRFEMDLHKDPMRTDFREKPTGHNFLDLLMEEIPGKDNYVGKLYDGGFDAHVMNIDGKTKKDVSRYHRWFKLTAKDAMGRQTSHRGFSDQFMFAAKTTQDRVSGLRLNTCVRHKGSKKKECTTRGDKWSYAVPLEIIYLTPLSKWNPYAIAIKPGCDNSINYNDTRVGEGLCKDMSKAKKFACSKFYYITPDSFYSGKEVETDPADTAKSGGWCMLNDNKDGVVARASGTRILMPDIPGVGRLRQRFPIAPIHGEGSPVWKNLNALTDIVMNNDTYGFMKSTSHGTADESFTFQLAMSQLDSLTPHAHYFTLLASEIQTLMMNARKHIIVDTDIREGHSHTLRIKYDRTRKCFFYQRCDDSKMCMDLHPKVLKKVTE